MCSEVIEKHTCVVSHIGSSGHGHQAHFEYPVHDMTRVKEIALVYRCGNVVLPNVRLDEVRDLHTFFAQLEEEMVRRMPEIIGKEIVGEI